MKFSMNRRRFAAIAVAATLATSSFGALAQSKVTLLNVSYDPTRELYQDYNAAFIKIWKVKTGEDLTVRQPHGGSGSQARAAISPAREPDIAQSRSTSPFVPSLKRTQTT